MKNQKGVLKAVALFMTIMIAVLGLASCGKDSTKNKDGKTIVSVGSWPKKNGPDLELHEQWKKDFEASNSDIAIEPDSWNFELKTFYAKATGGQLPTLYNAFFTEFSQIVDSAYAADLTDAIKKYDLEDKFADNIKNAVSKDGKIYAFPYNPYVLGLGYNTELFEKAGLMEEDGTPMQPKNWDEVAEFAVKIKNATGKPGMVFPTASNYGGWMFTTVARSFGTEFMKKDKNDKWRATFDSPEAATALQYIKDLKWKYDVLPANTLIDGTEYYKTYATGNAAMLMCAGDFTGRVVQYGMTPDKVGIMAMPAGPKRHVTLLGGGIRCVNPEATKEQIDGAVRWCIARGPHKLTDEAKQSIESQLKKDLEENKLIGIKNMTVWNGSTDAVEYEHNLIDKYSNANPNHVRLYNEFVKSDVEIQPEEPVCAQELYSILDSCLQKVLSDPDADVKDVLKKANNDFQVNYLNNVDY